MLWKLPRRPPLDLGNRALIMGVVNATPDSFSEAGQFASADAAIAQGIRLHQEGADILDIGGESTRPGAEAVDIAEEMRRVLPVIRGLAETLPGVLLSIDTMKAEVAAAALDAGACIINDVTGLTGDTEMPALAAGTCCGVVVMHMQGRPRDMQVAPVYDDVVAEVRDYLGKRFDDLVAAGIAPEAMVFDPGIGFGKSIAHNLDLLRSLDSLAPAGRPLLLGISRKSILGTLLGGAPVGERSWATVAMTSFARERGARILRVHEAAPNVQALRMTEAILGASA
ncbi:MAG: dihydropteroate synthase [Verrucomicrobiales bacterium]